MVITVWCCACPTDGVNCQLAAMPAMVEFPDTTVPGQAVSGQPVVVNPGLNFAALVEELCGAQMPVPQVPAPQGPVPQPDQFTLKQTMPVPGEQEPALPVAPNLSRKPDTPVLKPLPAENPQQPVAFAVVVPQIVIPEPLRLRIAPRPEHETAAVRVVPQEAAPVELPTAALLPNPAVQLKLRELASKEAPEFLNAAAPQAIDAAIIPTPQLKPEASIRASVEAAETPKRKQTLDSGIEIKPVEAVASPATVHIMPQHHPQLQHSAGKQEVPVAQQPARAEAEVAEQPKSGAPLRTVSIDFSPDGAQDVRLRLSERAGDVHVSLHSADGALSGSIHAGVGDLVQSLAAAGYDAQAWTPDDGREQQRQRRFYEYDQSTNSRNRSGDTGDYASIEQEQSARG